LTAPSTRAELEELLAKPSDELVDFAGHLDGDVQVIGAGGKMGPSLVGLLHNAIALSGSKARVIAVSRFSDGTKSEGLRALGVKVLAVDLLDEDQLHSLPDSPNVIDMLGQKFGTTGNEPTTWAINTYLAGRVMHRFRGSRVVFVSSGNVYPLVETSTGGSTESQQPAPVGEYAQSRLGGERLVEYYSAKEGTKSVIVRLNYAVELRYGVLRDIGRSVLEGRAIDLRMGHVNVIWLRDANEMIIRSLGLASSPSRLLNLTGPEVISVRQVAERFGAIFGTAPKFVNKEEPTSLLNDASVALRTFGPPRVGLDEMIAWTADWLRNGRESLSKPTHFQDREGRF